MPELSRDDLFALLCAVYDDAKPEFDRMRVVGWRVSIEMMQRVEDAVVQRVEGAVVPVRKA